MISTEPIHNEPTDFPKISESLLASHKIIAGPCSAETREQLLATASELSSAGVPLLRAGLWKPRTSAGKFEGVGEVGIPWMTEARSQYGIGIATEVATPRHAELCLAAGFDMVWVGARTVSNPFAVQELADALAGTSIPVMVKNPISPDLDLWIGALDRLAKKNVNVAGAIHRGFSYYEKSKYRNYPQWDIPLKLRDLRPDLPLINDPSHIAGKAELVSSVAQYALDLQFDGLIVESHICPADAWSDASQQLTPRQLVDMLNNLRVSISPDIHPDIPSIRSRIDRIDQQLIHLLSERMELCREIGEVKRSVDTGVLQKERFNEILNNWIVQGNKYGLDSDFVKDIINKIHMHSIDIQINQR